MKTLAMKKSVSCRNTEGKGDVSFTVPMTRKQAQEIYALGGEAVVTVLMELAQQLARSEAAKSPSPSTPSGMIPPYAKAAVRKRRNRPGAKPGHPGSRREAPNTIPQEEEHPPLQRCPDCGSDLNGPTERRFRVIEEIAGEIDLIEVLNSRSPFPANSNKAIEFAVKHDIAQGAGSDAHTTFEIGNAYVEMPEFEDRDGFLRAIRQATIGGRRSSTAVKIFSTWAKVKNQFFNKG